MASILTRKWKARGPNGRMVTRIAYGFSVQVACKPCPHRKRGSDEPVHANGVRQEKKFGWPTREEAQNELAKFLLGQEEAEAEKASPKTLAQVVDEYLAFKEKGGKRSLKEDRRILKKRLVPAFGSDTKVTEITPALIGQYERTRVGQVSAYTVANELTVLRHLLRLARRWGYISTVPEVVLPKKPNGRLRYLDEAEIQKLVTACGESKNKFLKTIVILAVNTGMRKGEILALEWQRIDLSSARITLYETKNGNPRGVPINRAVYEALITLEPDPKLRYGRLFRRRNGAAWGQIRTAFTKALDRAGIKNCRFHDLRHTAASHMVMRGATLQEVKEVLGHSDIKMTLRYSHLSPAHLRAAVNKLDGLTPVQSALAPSSSHSHPKAQQTDVQPEPASGKLAEVQPAPVAQVDRAAVS